MKKIEVIQSLCSQNGLSKAEATKIVSMFFEQMSAALERGDRVEIRGLCSFYVKDYPGYTGRNPKTGIPVEVAPKKLPFFKCGKDLKDRMNQL
jgi:integration host factor subunit beta